MIEQKGKARRSLRRHITFGLAALVVAAGGAGGWAAMSELSGAVVVSGLFVVDSNVKKVQHPTGGIVKELLVQDGDRTQAGNAIVLKSLDELAARQVRLEAERDADESIAFPDSLVARRRSDPDVERVNEPRRPNRARNQIGISIHNCN